MSNRNDFDLYVEDILKCKADLLMSDDPKLKKETSDLVVGCIKNIYSWYKIEDLEFLKSKIISHMVDDFIRRFKSVNCRYERESLIKKAVKVTGGIVEALISNHEYDVEEDFFEDAARKNCVIFNFSRGYDEERSGCRSVSGHFQFF